jgi:hypothetical protein
MNTSGLAPKGLLYPLVRLKVFGVLLADLSHQLFMPARHGFLSAW